ncbi:MAG TPA: carbon starvation CstA family protein [Planctomycetota bacterium]|nr:carbon starvation CstA family protein [Planctomycetota bacterium]
MSLPLLVGTLIVVLGLGYRTYGRFVARQYALDGEAATPAVRREDGVDFVPTRPFYLLGQHFSAIAAAGPIAGPIFACQQFGWLPCVLWIGLGVVFIGAVHDFSTLVASVRHDARSIAEIVRAHVGPRAWLAFSAFLWVALVYVILAFVDITASTFVAGDADTAGLEFGFDPGGAVAAASTLYLGLAIVMGLVQRWWNPPLWLATAIFVPATLGAVWAGTQLSGWLRFDATTWSAVILAYCFVASLVPLWALLQPRGYLGGFVLYLALAAGVAGVAFGGFEVKQPAFRAFDAGGETGLLFPFLFVTIACGACSGFHGLVCSGTTSKQIARETHCTPVGYGAMLLEAFVAVIALATVLVASDGSLKGKAAGAIYGQGLGRFVAAVVGERHLALATTFGAMAFSTFVFDTLDVSTRLGRYVLQELFGWTGRPGALAATGLTCAVPMALLFAGGPGSYRSFWTLFGTSNQLLAALSLLGVSVWLRRSGRRAWFTLAPMAFVLAVTLSALALQIRAGFTAGATRAAQINAIVSVLLAFLAGSLVVLGFRAMRAPAEPSTSRS